MSRQERETGTTETEGSGGRLSQKYWWGQAYVLGIIVEKQSPTGP